MDLQTTFRSDLLSLSAFHDEMSSVKDNTFASQIEKPPLAEVRMLFFKHLLVISWRTPCKK